MPKQFDLLVFDWDGTLMDSAASISSSLRAACADLELPVPSEASTRYVIGLGLADSLKYLLPDYPASGYPALLERYRHHFVRQDRETTLFTGAVETLHVLHGLGFTLAVATGKSPAADWIARWRLPDCGMFFTQHAAVTKVLPNHTPICCCGC